MSIEVTILGCASSSGVPAVGNNWGKCNPQNPKNRRLRSSILVKSNKTSILIDATPDLRQQLLNADVQKLDGVLITHTHADHINGIDDFRFLNVIMKKSIELYASKKSMIEIENRFGYVLKELVPEAKGFFYKPHLKPNIINSDFNIKDLNIIPFQQDHGYSESTGFRINNMAYSSDVVNLSEEAFSKLNNLDLWIVDCLRYEPHQTHSHLEKTLQWIKRVKPKRSVLTHMNIEVDYDDIQALLPNNCEAAFDGMVIKC
tara:strand:- start:197 stop:973 length:777 start_codon:yes stop_codon:yes gene_type:complete